MEQFIYDEIQKEKQDMIISASGWRKIFVESQKEEDPNSKVNLPNLLICRSVALAFAKALKPTKPILIGTDTRPTGPVIAENCCAVWEKMGIEYKYVGQIATPEILAESQTGSYSSFYYISASHNPIGHNGFKFGSNGGVFNKEEVQPIINEFEKIIENKVELDFLSNIIINKINPDLELKRKASETYRKFIIKIIFGEEKPKSGKKIGVAIDFNGSARTLSIDEKLLSSLNIETSSINAKAGNIVHAIVPEAENLEYCKEQLQKCYDANPYYALGYMPDCDGDRGNLVYINKNGKAEILSAQQVFALTVYASLSFCKDSKKAIACNGPTSLRIDEICKRKDAKCFRSEVGEANVVNLAHNLRNQGYKVPMCGEGSNGGCILYPSKVRDPLTTVLTVIKLLQSSNNDLPNLLEVLPKFTTTDAFSDLAGLKVRNKDYKTLKNNYEKLFKERWNSLKQQTGFDNFREYQTQGTKEKEGIGEEFRSGEAKGGLKIAFFDDKEEVLGFIWLRPSGTEPLLRLMADVKGENQELHDLLLSFQRTLIIDAQQK
ncbi:MAG: phosphoglucomutase [Sphaerochaetaceae bacterium]|nr:phosphoglucomutase [Sphaerochaetaceae bacterium]